MSRKVGLDIDVLTAAKERIAWTFETFEPVTTINADRQFSEAWDTQ